MVTDEMVEKAVNAATLSVIKEHPMGHWRDDQVKEVARRAIVEAALSAAEPVELYNADALMNDGGDNRQTAAEEVLTYLLIEVVGAPDDVPYSANRAGVLIEERLKQQPAPSVAVKALEQLLKITKTSVVSADGPHRVILKDGTTATGELADRWLEFVLLMQDVCKKALSAQVQDVATHRHKKRGTGYVLIGVGRIQTETWEDMTYEHQVTSVDMREVAIYRSVDDASLWVRPVEEFNDGRFEPLPAAPAKQEG